ncbi:hypothetical protein L6R53_19795 [Myxococcota bacterium]|nr:hypothetical protein [Myxococcota bacterium]
MRAQADRWAPLGQVLAGGLLLSLACLLAYQPALRGGYIWDDQDWIVQNPLLVEPGGLARTWLEPRAFHQYYPLTLTSFWLEQRLWGQAPLGHHLVNVGLHALSATLLWRVLAGLGLRGAYAAALLFALHPVGVESVAWITERKNVLSLALALGSLWALLPLLVAAPARPRDRPGRALLAAGLFLLALLAKTAVAPLPAVVLVLRAWRHGRAGLGRGWTLGLGLPGLGLAGALAGVTAWMERVEVGAAGQEWALSAAERLLVAGRAAWFYAGQVLVPRPSCFIHPRWTLEPSSLAQGAAPVAALGLLLGLFLARRRLGRGPVTVVALFLGILSPALGFVDVYAFRFSFVADHWAYHATPVLLAAACHALAGPAARLPRFVRPALVALPALALLGLTRAQAAHYVDAETLFRATTACNPGAFMAHANLGVLLLDRGQVAEGLDHLSTAHALAPGDRDVTLDLGVALDLSGQDAAAAAHYQAALARDPAQGPVLAALSDLRARSRDPAVRDPLAAVDLAEQAVALHRAGGEAVPPALWATLAQAQAASGRREAALAAAREGLAAAQAEGDGRMVAVFEGMLGGR